MGQSDESKNVFGNQIMYLWACSLISSFKDVAVSLNVLHISNAYEKILGKFDPKLFPW